MKFNDLDLKNWKLLDINVDSLWIIKERDKRGRHENIYHGNFIPQIPNQLIRRFTKKEEIVLDPFMGSGTTLFECDNLGRKFIGFDINDEIIKYVKSKMFGANVKYVISECDVTNETLFNSRVKNALDLLNYPKVHFVLLHPPYLDIIKFTDKENDLSHISDVNVFLEKLKVTLKISLEYLEKSRYFAVVVGDLYKNSEILPLAFYVLNMIKQEFNVKLKGIVVKNIEGNRGKLGKNEIWKYRALKSDYFIFKHEYILVFKKEF